MSYTISMRQRAAHQLAALAPGVYKPVRDAIRALSDEALPSHAAAVPARDGWRLRVGKYRVIYRVNQASQSIMVLDISPRSDA